MSRGSESHGMLNPSVFKDELVKAFHDAKNEVKKELTEDFMEAKEAIKGGISETKASLKEGLKETKDTLTENVKGEIADTKGALKDATIGKVKTLVDDAKETAKTTGKSISSVISDNPIPMALIGVGVAWLLVNRARRSEFMSTGVIGQAIGSGKEFAHDLTSGIKEKASGLLEGAEHIAKDAGAFAKNAERKIEAKLGDVAGSASGLASSAATQGSRLKDGASDFYQKNPVVVGAAAAAVGAAVGALIPMTKVESQWMGGARASVVEKVESIAHEAIEKVDDAAKQLSGAGTSQSEREGSDKQTKGDKPTETTPKRANAAKGTDGAPNAAANTDGKMGEDEPKEERSGSGFGSTSPWPTSRT